MKRCKLIERITKWEWEQIVGFAISVVIGISVAIMILAYTDNVPASQSNYQQLEKQAEVIDRELYDFILQTDCDVAIKYNGRIITVELENNECKLIRKYDKEADLRIISTTKKDKSEFWLATFCGAVLICGFEIYFVGWILTLVICLINGARKRILKKIEEKNQNK